MTSGCLSAGDGCRWRETAAAYTDLYTVSIEL